MHRLIFTNPLYLQPKPKTTIMNQFFKLRNEKTWKTLLLTENEIMIVNKSYDSPEEFLEKFNEKGLLKERLEISVLDVSKIVYSEIAVNAVTITYPKKDKETELKLVFDNVVEQEQFVQAVAKPRGMAGTTQQVSVMKAIGSPLIGLGVTALLAFITYQDAEIIEAGGEVDTSGRRSLYKKLFAWLGETLGTQGTIIAGAAIGLLCIYFIYKNLKARPVEVVYSSFLLKKYCNRKEINLLKFVTSGYFPVSQTAGLF
jgi:hypothetical protein